MTTIHPSAIVDSAAELGDGVTVGPFSYIGPGVRIGSGTRIAAHVTIDGDVRIGRDNEIHPQVTIDGDVHIGRDNKIHPQVVLGGTPIDYKHKGTRTKLEIGDRNLLREQVTAHPGTEGGGGITRIGNDNLLSVGSHIGHDCQLGNDIRMIFGSPLAGHVIVEDGAVIGVHSKIAPFIRIGTYSYCGPSTQIYQDVPPYQRVIAPPTRVLDINAAGIERAGLDSEALALLKQAHNLLYRDDSLFKDACDALQRLATEHPHQACLANLHDFLAQSAEAGRSLMRSRR